MARYAGNARRVWNLCLARQQELHAIGQKFVNSLGMNAWLPEFKHEFEYLRESPSQTLQQVTKDLERAFRNFFEKRADFPIFKKKGRHSSFRFPQGFKLDQLNNRIFLPKLGYMRYRNSRKVEGVIKNMTISLVANKWYVSIQTEREVPDPIHPSTSVIGIDVGIARFATLSDGSFIAPLNSFKKHEVRLARYQRAMSRKVKFSQNWKKARSRATKLHQRIAHIRRDFLHKASSHISKNHAMIVIEDLKVSNMSASSKGSAESPGRMVRQKSGLNKSILDQGWFEFRRQSEYKQVWLGGTVLAIDPRNTSRTCPACGCISKENRKTQTQFMCTECGYENHADHVGAINILAAGHAVLACGEKALQGRSMKQEPAEATQERLCHV